MIKSLYNQLVDNSNDYSDGLELRITSLELVAGPKTYRTYRTPIQHVLSELCDCSNLPRICSKTEFLRQFGKIAGSNLEWVSWAMWAAKNRRPSQCFRPEKTFGRTTWNHVLELYSKHWAIIHPSFAARRPWNSHTGRWKQRQVCILMAQSKK